MRNGLRQDRLHVVGCDVVARHEQRLRLGGTHNGDARARAQALQEPLAAAAGGDQVLHIVEQRIGRVNLQHRHLQLRKLFRRKQRGQGQHQFAPVLSVEQSAFGRAIRVTERDAHQKAVELGLGQCVGAKLVMRVLRGDDEKRGGQGTCFALDAHLLFFHRLEQGALGFRAGPVDLVGQQNLGKDRTWVEYKGLLGAFVDRHAGEITGHQIGSELHA